MFRKLSQALTCTEVEGRAIRAAVGKGPDQENTVKSWPNLVGENPSLKRLAPMVAYHHPSPPHWLVAAQIYESHRWKAYRKLVRGVLENLEVEGLYVGVPAGPRLAEEFYPEPHFRHCHGLRLWLLPGEFLRARSLLNKLGFTGGHSSRLVHQDGLELNFCAPQIGKIELSPDSLEVGTVCGVRVHVLPLEMLISYLVIRLLSCADWAQIGLDLSLVAAKAPGSLPNLDRCLKENGVTLAYSALRQNWSQEVGQTLPSVGPLPWSFPDWLRLVEALRIRHRGGRAVLGRITGYRERLKLLAGLVLLALKRAF